MQELTENDLFINKLQGCYNESKAELKLCERELSDVQDRNAELTNQKETLSLDILEEVQSLRQKYVRKIHQTNQLYNLF